TIRVAGVERHAAEEKALVTGDRIVCGWKRRARGVVADASLYVVDVGADSKLKSCNSGVGADVLRHNLIDTWSVCPAGSGATTIFKLTSQELLSCKERTDASLMWATVVSGVCGHSAIYAASN